jgi:hypothetical protein
LNKLKAQLDSLKQPEIVLEDESVMSSPHVNPHSQQSLNALSANEHKGKEESSFLPDYVPIQE